MTPDANDLIETLRKLMGQLETSDGKFRNLSKDIQVLRQTIARTKEYRQELGILNNLSETQPRSSLITALKAEIKEVNNLETENRDLLSAIEQHKQVLEIVMNKYREQSKQLERINLLESNFRIPKNELDSERNAYLKLVMNEMTLIMDKACELDENKFQKQQQLIAKLKHENERIRKLLLYK